MYQGRKLKANSNRLCHIENNLRKIGFSFFFLEVSSGDFSKGHFVDKIKESYIICRAKYKIKTQRPWFKKSEKKKISLKVLKYKVFHCFQFSLYLL